ncbi:secretory carrier-associated membrane protein 3-like isoform X2 [Henckelia pumila]|uniref:secretory carrier-associated membrane protein 3-like isoform X2 n=1 Tax=Henckelia pumila TaxID=405737 RepID=UPI003C6E0509
MRWPSSPFSTPLVNSLSFDGWRGYRKRNWSIEFQWWCILHDEFRWCSSGDKLKSFTLLPEPADFYNPTAPVDIPLDSAADLKKKERELQAKEAELKRREQEVKRKEEAAARAIFWMSRVYSGFFTAGIVIEEKNWPLFFPIIHHDITKEIQIHLQKLQYVTFTTFLVMKLGSFIISCPCA